MRHTAASARAWVSHAGISDFLRVGTLYADASQMDAILLRCELIAVVSHSVRSRSGTFWPCYAPIHSLTFT
jgi:hypothetical protein